MRPKVNADHLIAQLATRQHGVVSRKQLVEAGVDGSTVKRRMRRHTLQPVHRGVFAVGHRALTPEGHWMAAVLASGGVLSHRGAAGLHGIGPRSFVEVSARTVKRIPGVRVHRTSLARDEITSIEGLPATGISRTLLDLAAVLPRRQFERAVNEAETQGLTDALSLPDLLERYPGRTGTPVIRAVLETGATVTRSELEDRFLALLDAHGFPRPEVNAWLQAGGAWFECDCVWRRQGLIVELDGRAFHATAAAFERDRARDRRLQAAGWRTVRVTWRQLRDQPERLVADLRAILTGSLVYLEHPVGFAHA